MGKSFIKSVSITEEMFLFLEEHPEISLSTIVQSKLLSIMDFQKPSDIQIRQTKQRLAKALQFISDKGLYEDFKNVA